jgi:hypothetical protein
MLVMKTIIVGYLPLNFVQNSGFRDLLQAICPAYNPPSRYTISRSVLPNIYERAVEMVKTKLAEDFPSVEAYCCTTDCWTSQNSTTSFISLTLHYIDKKVELQKLTLSVSPLCGSHTSEKISSEFKKMLRKFDLKINEEKTYVVTDNASNMKKAFEDLFGVTRLSCIGHDIQLVVNAVKRKMPEFQKLSEKSSKIVSKFNHSYR